MTVEMWQLVAVVLGGIGIGFLVCLPDMLAELKQEWKRKREREKLMRDTYKKYKGLWIPRGAEDRRYQRASISPTIADSSCHQGQSTVRCGGIYCTNCILHRGNDKVADTYYTFQVARTYRGLFVPETVDENYIPQPASSWNDCRRSSAEWDCELCCNRVPMISCENCILGVHNVEVASTFFKNNNDKEKEMKSKLITYDRVFELPISMLAHASDAACVSYAVMLTTSAARPRISADVVRHRLSQDLDYESYVINVRGCIDTVAVTFSTEIVAKGALTRINKWAATTYPAKDSENLVSQFCEDIDACEDGRAFASKYDSLAALWDGMIDNGAGAYLHFVVTRLEDSQPLRMRYVANPHSWPKVSSACKLVAERYREQTRLISCPSFWFETFTADYLKSINPFKKQ